MSIVYRFPRPTSTPQYGPAETNLVLTAFGPTNSIPKAGGIGSAGQADMNQWRTQPGSAALNYSPSLYVDAVIEFTTPTNADMVIGNGTTDRIGLYGSINSVGFFLIGILGVSLGGAALQIPLTSYGAGMTGYAQRVCDIGAYDTITIGGVQAAIALAANVTVKLRPIIRREYGG